MRRFWATASSAGADWIKCGADECMAAEGEELTSLRGRRAAPYLAAISMACRIRSSDEFSAFVRTPAAMFL